MIDGVGQTHVLALCGEKMILTDLKTALERVRINVICLHSVQELDSSLTGPNAIIFDLSLATESDEADIRNIRELFPRVPVLLVADSPEKVLNRDGSVLCGCSGFLLTPLQSEQAAAWVRTLISGPTESRQAPTSQLLADASRLLAGSLHYKTILAGIARFVVPVLSDWCLAYVVDGSALKLVAAVHANPGDAPIAHDLRRSDLEGPFIFSDMAELVISSGKSHVFDDPELTEWVNGGTPPSQKSFLQRLGVRSAMAVPLSSRGQQLGVLFFIDTNSRRHFGPEDLILAGELAIQVSLAVDNARLFENEKANREEAEESQRKTAVLYDLTASLSTTASLQDVAGVSLSKILPAAKAKAGIIVIGAGEDLSLIAGTGYSEAELKQWVRISPDARLPLNTALRDREIVVLSSREERLKHYPELQLREEFGGHMAVPLFFEDKFIGAMALSFETIDESFPRNVSFITTMARQCAQALERARLFSAESKARADADESRRRLQFLVEASQVLAGSLEFETPLTNLAQIVIPHFADWCIVDLLRGTAIRRLTVAYADQHQAPLARSLQYRHTADPNALNGIAEVTRTQHARIYGCQTIEGVSADPELPQDFEPLKQAGVHCIMVVPIKSVDRVLGALSFAYQRPDAEYTIADLNLAEDLASRAALAMENSSLFHNAQRALKSRRRALANMRRRARQQGAVAELSQSALAGTQIPELLNKATSLLAEHLEVEFTLVQELLPDRKSFRVAAGSGWAAEDKDEIVSTEVSHAGYTIRVDQPAVFTNLLAEKRFTGSPLLHRHAVISGAAVVIPGSTRPFGTLGVYSTQSRRFSAYDIYFLQATGNVLGAAIQKNQAEAARLESETRLQRLAESDLVGIVFANINGQIIDANNAFLNMLGYARNDIDSGRLHWDQITPAKFRSVDQMILERLVTERRCSPVEKAYIAESGKIVPVLIGAALLEQTPNVAVFIVVDVSERNTALEALQESEEQYRAMVQSVRDYAILMLDSGGRVSSWNHGAESIFGYMEHEILGQNISVFFADDLSPGEHQDKLAITDRDGRFHEEAWCVRRDGTPLWAELFYTALKKETGETRGFSLITRDVTERRLAEERIRKINEELGAARDQAIKASAAKSIFLANVSHELRTPLNAIIGYSEMLQEEAADVQQQWIIPELQKITDAGQTLLSLISEILELSRVESGRLTLYPEYFEVDTVLREVALTIQPLVAENSNTLNLRLESEVGTMCCDLSKLRQILFNLLSNSCQFSESGTITLSARKEVVGGESFMCFTVEDTGVGMTSGQLDQLFDEFSQADAQTARRFGGSGLGLAITRRLVRLMGGDIEARSAVGKGSRFQVRLPVQSKPTDED